MFDHLMKQALSTESKVKEAIYAAVRDAWSTHGRVPTFALLVDGKIELSSRVPSAHKGRTWLLSSDVVAMAMGHSGPTGEA